jgi:hypothetical protein
MTKLEMVEQIEFALSELADVEAELGRIVGIKIEDRRDGDYFGSDLARTIGRAEGIASNAQIFLGLATDNLRLCLPDDRRSVPVKRLFERVGDLVTTAQSQAVSVPSVEPKHEKGFPWR